MARPLKPALVWHVDHYRFRCRVKDGGRPWVDLPVGLTVAQAEKSALELATMAARGELSSPDTPTRRRAATPTETFAAWAERWTEAREARGKVTASDSLSHLKHHVFVPLGPRPMARITKSEIEDLVDSLDQKVQAGKLAWKTAINIWATITKAFGDAAHSKDRTLRVREDNPAAGVRGPDRGARKVKTFLFPAEAHALLSSEAVPLGFRRAAALAIYLGLRAGELRSLSWDDIDLDTRRIHVHQGFDRKKHTAKGTKSNKGRQFTIERAALPLLRQLRAEAGGKGPVLKIGRFYQLAKDLRGHLERAGVTRADLFVTDETRKNLTFHDLRATTFTWMAIRGDNPLVIKETAGHSDLKQTEEYIRTATQLTGAVGTLFQTLPAGLLGEGLDTTSGPDEGETTYKSASKRRVTDGLRTPEAHDETPGCGVDVDGEGEGEAAKPTRKEGVSIPSASIADPIEAALTAAMTKATIAGEWTVVKALVGELEARRSARVGVIDLAEVRRAREMG